MHSYIHMHTSMYQLRYQSIVTRSAVLSNTPRVLHRRTCPICSLIRPALLTHQNLEAAPQIRTGHSRKLKESEDVSCKHDQYIDTYKGHSKSNHIHPNTAAIHIISQISIVSCLKMKHNSTFEYIARPGGTDNTPRQHRRIQSTVRLTTRTHQFLEAEIQIRTGNSREIPGPGDISHSQAYHLSLIHI